MAVEGEEPKWFTVRTWEDMCEWVSRLESRIEQLEQKMSEPGATVVGPEGEGRR